MTGRTDVPTAIDTGERLIPDLHEGAVVHAEHMVRYLFAAPLAANRRVADVASGSGYGAGILRDAGAALVVGIDYSAETVAYATGRYERDSLHFVAGDAERLPLADGGFDMVVSFETIEHLHKPEAFLDEVHRILAPGGLLVVSTPNRGVFPEGNPFHVHEFSLDELREAVDCRFKNSVYLLQNNWTLSTIYSAERTAVAGTDNRSDAKTIKLAGVTPEESLYAVCLCSDGPLPDTEELAVVSGIYETRGFQGKIARLQEEIERLRVVWDHVATKDRGIEGLQTVVAEKDSHIKELLQMVAEKDSHISALLGMVEDRDRFLAAKNAELDEARRYSLARLTRPARRLLGKGKQR